MKKLRAKLTAKILAIFFLVIFASSFAASGLATILMYSEGYYNTESYYDTQTCKDSLNSYYNRLKDEIISYSDANDDIIKMDDLSSVFVGEDGMNSNFLFSVADASGKIILTNTDQLTNNNKTFRTLELDDGSIYQISYSLADILSNDDVFAQGENNFETFNPYKWILLVVCVITFLFSGGFFIFLLCSAGHHDEGDEVTLNFQDKIPLEIYLGIIILGVYICVELAAIIYFAAYAWSYLIFLLPVFIILGLMTLAVCMTMATRFKTKTLLTNTLTYQILKTIWNIVTNIKLLWQVCGIFGAYAFLILIFQDAWILITFIFVSTMFIVIANSVIQLDRLFTGGRKLAEGDMNYKIDTKRMRWKYREHADNLNHIRIGMSKAVANEMKSERLKTELITNVSHDIKTPLTSILNYVDLLKKEDLNNKTALEYLEVLDRQSKRLKKMTEDLVEASKASTGNLPVAFERMNIVELMNQAIGEYEEIFINKGLVPIFNPESTEIYISADGKLLWRVLDNLFTNVCKYAQINTRIYIDINRFENKVLLSIKNISADPLNISSEELVERFVRGDVARTTEGSGLGLSITRSLVELQKATFKINIDGDLFKAEIIFTELT